MPQATLTPKFINPPRGNARSASIKDENGSYWGIHPGDMSKFTANVPVTVEYATSENNGKVYYNIKSIVGQQASANPQAQHQGSRPQINAPQMAIPNQQRPLANPQADPRKSEDIFVCGVINHAIAHQSLPLDSVSLRQVIAAARTAWRNGEPDAQSGLEAPPAESEEDYYRA